MTFRRALSLSVRSHLVFALMLWAGSRLAAKYHWTEQRKADARSYQQVYQRNAAENHADRLARMREIIDRLHAQEKPEDAPLGSDVKPQRVQPGRKNQEPPPIGELWQKSREQYMALREKFLDEKAAEYARLTKTDGETARKEMETRYKSVAPADVAAPASAGRAAEDIGRMHDDGQRMLSEAVLNSKRESEGAGLSQGAGADEIYQLTQNGPGSIETREFQPVADHTPLLVSRKSQGNGKLDTPESLRLLRTAQAEELKKRFAGTGRQIQFTRRIGGAETRHAEWVSPDAWYMIGPFPNPWRSQIETSFPPEVEINRDATYEGRDGRPLSWEYVRVHNLNARPPDMADYGVYYAYTEIHCARPFDCWVAIGSDDYSKVWLNGLLIWAGAKDEKVWSATEGFRRVHFDQGVNRVLYRLENGINACEFSFILGLE